jgi:hypothetical protein
MSSGNTPTFSEGMHPSTGKLFLMTYVPKNGDRNNETTHQHKTMLRPRTYQVNLTNINVDGVHDKPSLIYCCANRFFYVASGCH